MATSGGADAVLKLQLGNDGPIRRIPMKLLLDSTGLVSYQKLIDLVIEHHRTTNSFPKDTPTDALPDGFQTRFSYTDEDGDVVTISSDHELSDAFQQLASKAIPVLRVLATTTFALHAQAYIMDPLTGKLVDVTTGPVKSEHRIKSDINPAKKDKKQVLAAMESVAGVLIATADRLVAAVEAISPLPPAAKKELIDNMNRLVATTDSKLQKKQVLASLQNIAGTLISTVDRLVNTADVIQPLPPAAKKELMETMDHLVKTTGTKLQKKQVEAALESVASNLVAAVDRLVTTVEAVKPAQVEPFVARGSNIKFKSADVPNVVNSTIEESSKTPEDSVTEAKMKKRQILAALENLASLLIATVDRLVNSVETIRPLPSSGIVKAGATVGSLTDPEIVVTESINANTSNLPDTIEKSTVESSEKAEADADPENSPGQADEAPQRFDPNFIHGRHTCDSCLTSPIIGIRYHAVNLPDYDLCSKCVSKYKGKNISFEPVELDRDRYLQTRWRHHQSKCRYRRIPKPDFTTDNYDAALKEAIRRSLEDTSSSADLSLKEEAKSNPEATATVDSPGTHIGNIQMEKEEATEAPDGSVRGTDASCVHVPSSESHSGTSVDQLDWELLNDSHPVDTEVALAAEVLGSKLFLNVDSQTTVHSSTLNSNAESVVTDAEPSRWEMELKKLHELGFVDDNVNVDALETLEAANIGVESVDPVTVEQVVDYLIKKTY